MTTTLTTTRVLLATIAGALAFLVAGVGGAAAAPAASQQATDKCWLQVINDWEDNNQVDKIYAIPCYTQAIQILSGYPDIAGYSSAIDDIRAAMLAVIHQEGRGGPGSSDGSSSPIVGGPNPKPPAGHKSLWTRFTDRLAPGNAQSIPLPLIVLAGLALLLLLAAAATWFARRLQTRRVTPAPAPAPAPRR
jgi:uncharacterized membrane protein YidH (DUF202 family)